MSYMSNPPGVQGPVSSVLNDIAVFADTSGRVIKDGGQTIAQLLAAVGFTFADVAFSATDFAATLSMTWTVGAGDVATYRYATLGKLMIVWLQINTSTVGGTVAGANLTVKLPNAVLAAKAIALTALAAPAGAASEGVIANFIVGSNLMTILRYAANWVLGADNTSVNVMAVIETQ